MNFRTYDLLVQLIPGTLLMVAMYFILDVAFVWESVVELKSVGLVMILTIISFIIGYVLNSISHILESCFFKSVNGKVMSFYNDEKITVLYKVFICFSNLQYLDGKNEKERTVLSTSKKEYNKCYQRINKEEKSSLSWMNQDIKFARVLTTTILIIILILLCRHDKFDDFIFWRIFAGLFTVMLFSFYRYFHYKIDYAYKVIKISRKPVEFKTSFRMPKNRIN